MSDADRIIQKIRGGISTAKPFWQGIAKVLGFPIQVVDATTTTYGVPDDGNLLVTVETAVAGGPYTVTLPVAPAAGQRVIVKDSGGNAETETIVVDPNGFLIEGVAGSAVIALNWDFRYLLFDGTQWLVIVTGVGGVTSVFGRTGDVIAAAGDYDADQVDYDNATSGLTATDVQGAIDELEAGLDNDVIAGAGLTGGGSLQGGDVTLDVIANVDGSIVVNADNIQVGVITEPQHGDQPLNDGLQHAVATTSFAGFMSPADKTKLDGIEDDADVDDKDVMVSANDTTPGFLATKLVAGSNITLTELNDGSNETFRITANVPTVGVDTFEEVLDEQGAAAAVPNTSITVRLTSNLDWIFVDNASADIVRIEDRAGTSAFIVDAGTVDFGEQVTLNSNSGTGTLVTGSALTFRGAGTGATISVGSGKTGVLSLTSDYGTLRLNGFTDLQFQDENRQTSTFSIPLNLSDSVAQWSQFDTEFGEVSLLEAIYQAAQRPSPASSPAAADYWGEFSTLSSAYTVYATFAWPSEFSGFTVFYVAAEGLDSMEARVKHSNGTTVAEITGITTKGYYEDTTITSPAVDGYADLELRHVSTSGSVWGWGFL